MIVTERLEKVSLFLKMYRDSKSVSFKELFDYSSISTSTERSRNLFRINRDYKDVDL